MEYSLEEKIGQMVMSGFAGYELHENTTVFKAIKKYHLGNVWLTDSPAKEGNIKSADQLKTLIDGLNTMSGLPLLVAIDAEGGRVIRLKEEYGFPATFSAERIGRMDNPKQTFAEAQKIAILLRSLGININLAPVVDLAINPHNPSLANKERCFSDQPEIVYKHARAVIEAHHTQGVLCCLKHFPGHGSTAEDSHLGFVDASKTWSRTELEPYIRLLKDSLVDAIIPAHILINQMEPVHPATLSGNIINGLLRAEMGYDGLVISDDLLMGAIRQNYSQTEAIELAVNAGVDILLYSKMEQDGVNIAIEAIKKLKYLCEKGRIPSERIEQSFRRILRLKRRVNQKLLL